MQTQKAKTQTLNHIELQRLKALSVFEDQARNEGYRLIAGVDEAGRGPLAGPVVTAACIIPEGLFFPGVNDSKQLTPAKRHQLFETITSDPRVTYSFSVIDAQTIDQINIYQATLKGMINSIETLATTPDYILVDGMPLKGFHIPWIKIIKGDARSHTIAAASIIAKETRDRMMEEYDLKWPQYGFKQHKGYGTAAHLKAIEEHGPCPIHRMTFRGLCPLKTPAKGPQGPLDSHPSFSFVYTNT